mgnify:CR=1 FL=1
MAKTFTDYTFYAIACHCIARHLAGYCQPQARMLLLVGGGQYRHPAIIQSVAAAFKDTLVIFRFGEPYPTRERVAPEHKTGRSDRQPGPTLGTTGIDHTTAILGAHSGTKTMGTLALQVTGLKSSFHGTLLPNCFL